MQSLLPKNKNKRTTAKSADRIDGHLTSVQLGGEYRCFVPTVEIMRAYMDSTEDYFNQTGASLYIRELPSFEEVYARFMKYKWRFLRCNEQQAICLALLYNPYFDALYQKMKEGMDTIPKNRLRYLIKYLIQPNADEVRYRMLAEFGVKNNFPSGMYYAQHDIYGKCKELMQLYTEKKRV